MSVKTGTATGYLDLLNQLRTFLTTDATLTAAGQNWTELATNASSYTVGQDTVDFETYLKAPGLSGSEAIYLNIRAYHYVAGDYYNFELRGAQGYNASASFVNQPGLSPAAYVPLWNQPIPYWFIANGQRVIVVAKISTNYESLYMGKFLPYGTPGQYPYPVAIGGMTDTMDIRFSDTSGRHNAFFDPVALQVCGVDNSWNTFRNWDGNTNYQTYQNVWPWGYGQNDSNSRLTWMATSLDGGYPIFPARLEESSPSPNCRGELDGVGFVPGNQQSSENTINDGTNSWTVFQNAHRTYADAYCAIKMV
ncbi:hypothetical protein R77567_01612 [Ralstonia sp. LMG 32965]|uniref:Virion structural protein n=1 Tax=Ralstonia flatus TaxID=3058601 RepID=A0AAD2C5T9_9RALS|nr:hypothetical protein [Ralstonia sp. LMG 32965]MBN6211427.1 hypothetical protein [Ralstonia pickettii]CAJ0862053.1 hypothetical protein R77567_01612 [Ralstonia sp. LMG 32965]